MDPIFVKVLIGLGIIFLVAAAVLAFLMPFFVFKIRNEIVKLNYTVSKIDRQMKIP